MKLLHVVTSLNPKLGGVSEAIRNLQTGLIRFDNNPIADCHVVCFDDESDVQSWDNRGLKVFALGSVSNYWGYNDKFSNWLGRHLLDYTIVVVHGIWQYHSYAVYRAFSKIGVLSGKRPRLYIMPHGMLDPWFQNDSTRKLKAIRNAVYWRMIERKVIEFSDGLLFTCEQERLLAGRTFENYKPKKELVVGLGINIPPVYSSVMSELFESTFPVLKKRNYILFLGRIDYKKGVDLLVKAYSQVLKNNETGMDIPDLVIAGPGLETSFGEEIKTFVEFDTFLNQKIVFTGMLVGDMKWGALYGCDAFILPSHQENFGIAVVEALACCRPVLVSKQVNIYPEVLEMNSGIVEDDTLAGTIDLLTRFINLPIKDKIAMKDLAKKTYLRFFNIDTVAEKFIHLLTFEE